MGVFKGLGSFLSGAGNVAAWPFERGYDLLTTDDEERAIKQKKREARAAKRRAEELNDEAEEASDPYLAESRRRAQMMEAEERARIKDPEIYGTGDPDFDEKLADRMQELVELQRGQAAAAGFERAFAPDEREQSAQGLAQLAQFIQQQAQRQDAVRRNLARVVETGDITPPIQVEQAVAQGGALGGQGAGGAGFDPNQIAQLLADPMFQQMLSRRGR